MAKQIALLGATGSIGRSTLDVVRQYPDRYEIHSLTAGSRVDELVRLCAQWQPKIAVIADESRYSELVEKLAAAGLSHVRAMAGSAALCEIVALPEVKISSSVALKPSRHSFCLYASRDDELLLVKNMTFPCFLILFTASIAPSMTSFSRYIVPSISSRKHFTLVSFSFILLLSNITYLLY